MKIFAILTIFATMLFGGNDENSVNINEAQAYLNEIEPMMEAALFEQLDENQFVSKTDAFNTYLTELSSTTNDSQVQKYIELQTQANNARLIAVSLNNDEKITESARIQYEASTLYDEILAGE